MRVLQQNTMIETLPNYHQLNYLMIPWKLGNFLMICWDYRIKCSISAMCIGVWTLQHPGYSLWARSIRLSCGYLRLPYSILCTNRDEYLDRPTQDAHFHSFQTGQYSSVDGNVLSGRDVRAGGSWLGLNRAGRVALLWVQTLSQSRHKTKCIKKIGQI